MRFLAKKVNSDKIFDVANFLIMCILLVIFVWPLWFVVIASLSDPNEIWSGNVLLFPRGVTLAAYEELIAYKNIWIGYRNTLLYTVLGTIINVFLTIGMAYPLSRKDFVPRNFICYL